LIDIQIKHIYFRLERFIAKRNYKRKRCILRMKPDETSAIAIRLG